MAALTQTIQQAMRQLRSLPATAKLFIGSLLVILAMSLFLVALYAGRSDLAPLGLGSLRPEARTRAITYLQQRDIPHDARTGDIYVPADKKYLILSQLNEHQIISGDQIDFATLIADDSPFTDRATKRQRYLVAKMNVLAGMIGQMTGIERAKVVIDQPERRPGIGDQALGPSASVSVVTASELKQPQVDAIAELVAKSHAGMKVDDVAIIDSRSGRLHRARGADVLVATRYLESQLAAEKRVRDKLATQLSYIPGVHIAVNAIVDVRDEIQQTTSYEDAKVGPLAESTRTVSSSSAGGGDEAGVRPNVGTAIAQARPGGSSLSDERSQSETLPVFGQTGSRIADPKGYPMKINASVNVPKSYFVRLHQDRTDDDQADPDEATLTALVQTETDRIRKDLEPLIDTEGIPGATLGTVRVSMYADFAMTAGTPALEAGVAGSLAGGLSEGSMLKNIGLGSLAFVSLVMMFLMVRRANVREELPTPEELAGVAPTISADDHDLIGEVDEGSMPLEGVELDDDTVQRRQMLDQINDMARTRPDEAAALMRRWLKTED